MTDAAVSAMYFDISTDQYYRKADSVWEAIELSDMTHEARQRLLAFLSRAPEEAK